MTAPNLLLLSTAVGKTAVQAVGTSAVAILSNAASSGKLLIVRTLTISNVDGTSAADITVDIYRSATAHRIAKGITVPAQSSLVISDRDNPIYLEEGDDLRLAASATGDLEAICSYEELS